MLDFIRVHREQHEQTLHEIEQVQEQLNILETKLDVYGLSDRDAG